jgi:phosphohistidine phosphatase
MPRVFLIRHAEAEETAMRDGDGARRLTARGRERMTAAARGLSVLVDELTVIAHSPLLRAVQTAEIVAARFPGVRLTELQALLPTAEPAALLRWIAAQDGDVAVIGHEPMLSSWIGYAVNGKPRAIVQMKKSMICALEMPEPATAGAARILWLMNWRQLAAQK